MSLHQRAATVAHGKAVVLRQSAVIQSKTSAWKTRARLDSLPDLDARACTGYRHPLALSRLQPSKTLMSSYIELYTAHPCVCSKTLPQSSESSPCDCRFPSILLPSHLLSELRDTVGAAYPGYMIHESGAWSDVLQKWIFMPRRISSEAYDDIKDEQVGQIGAHGGRG